MWRNAVEAAGEDILQLVKGFGSECGFRSTIGSGYEDSEFYLCVCVFFLCLSTRTILRGHPYEEHTGEIMKRGYCSIIDMRETHLQ